MRAKEGIRYRDRVRGYRDKCGWKRRYKCRSFGLQSGDRRAGTHRPIGVAEGIVRGGRDGWGLWARARPGGRRGWRGGHIRKAWAKVKGKLQAGVTQSTRYTYAHTVGRGMYI